MICSARVRVNMNNKVQNRSSLLQHTVRTRTSTTAGFLMRKEFLRYSLTNSNALRRSSFRLIDRMVGIITDHLPVEGDYSHPPIDVGEVVFNSNDELVNIQIDLEGAKDQLHSRGTFDF